MFGFIAAEIEENPLKRNEAETKKQKKKTVIEKKIIVIGCECYFDYGFNQIVHWRITTK